MVGFSNFQEMCAGRLANGVAHEFLSDSPPPELRGDGYVQNLVLTACDLSRHQKAGDPCIAFRYEELPRHPLCGLPALALDLNNRGQIRDCTAPDHLPIVNRRTPTAASGKTLKALHIGPKP